ncbi:type VII secretion integral membrane protein EccD [Lipingzhangella halophila]|uniref:Type VII secretion integral membrane protein EccD n=1 Tax=Lipingzhangella halophila TaxID=1783352 RepID=A0A7W7RLL1_9ACTN|nr:type VII secretion integral membrane protein EccD [Lipingzhangella halophila]MBB4934240.1 type VII secretion integral membrane protein EccD [Lipingzhangella halophila]
MSGYCRVTVTGPERWADLALPGTVPVATILPQVIWVCSPDPEGTDSAGWALTTARGESVQPEVSLESQGVVDGDVLLLHRETARDRPAQVDDVRGAVEDRIDESAHIWRPSTTFAFGLLLAAIGPLAVLAVMMYLRPAGANVSVAALGALMSLGLMGYAGQRSMTTIGHVVLGAACLWGAGTAVLAVDLLSGAPQPLVLAAFACIGALVIAAIGWMIDELGLVYLAAIGVVTVAAGVLAAVGIFVDAAQGVRAVVVLLVLGVGVLPRIALAMGGLAGLDYEVRQVGQVDTERFEEDLTSSDRLLLGMVLGGAVSVTAAVPLLVVVGGALPDLLLAALVSLLMVFRSRLFDRISHVLPLRLGGVLGLGVAALGSIGPLPAIAPWLPALILAAGAAVAVLSGVRLADVPRASLRRTLNAVEIVVVIAMCGVTAWAMGLFHWVAALTA